jgi:hypothetical protein
MSCENTWYDLYFTQLFTTLGQLTAVVLSTSVSVPVLSYYYPAVNRLLMSWSQSTYELKTREVEREMEVSSDISDAHTEYSDQTLIVNNDIDDVLSFRPKSTSLH